MQKLDQVLLVAGLLAIAYALFSRFYGQPSVALHQFRSTTLILVGNTLLILAVLAKK